MDDEQEDRVDGEVRRRRRSVDMNEDQEDSPTAARWQRKSVEDSDSESEGRAGERPRRNSVDMADNTVRHRRSSVQGYVSCYLGQGGACFFAINQITEI